LLQESRRLLICQIKFLVFRLSVIIPVLVLNNKAIWSVHMLLAIGK